MSMSGSVRGRYAKEVGRFAQILATALTSANMAAVLAPVHHSGSQPAAAPTARQRHQRWTEILLDSRNAALREFWEEDHPDWSATTSGSLSLSGKQKYVARYASVLDDLLMSNRSVLDWLIDEAEACFVDLRLAAEGQSVSSRPTYVTRSRDGSIENLEGLKWAQDLDQKTELAANIRRFAEAFDPSDRRIVTKRINMAAVNRYTLVNRDTRDMLTAAIDGLVTLLTEAGVRGFVLDAYNDDAAPKRIVVAQTLVELLSHTDAGRTYVAAVCVGGTEFHIRNSPIHPDRWNDILDGFVWDAAAQDVAIVKDAAIWTGIGSVEAIKTSLGNAFAGNSKAYAKTYLTVLKTIRLKRAIAYLKTKDIGILDFAKLEAHKENLPNTLPGVTTVAARGVAAVHSIWAWVESIVAIAEARDRTFDQYLDFTIKTTKAVADMARLTEEFYGFSLARLHASSAMPVTLSPASAARRKAGATSAKAAAKNASQYFNVVALLVAVGDSVIEFRKMFQSDRFAEQLMHGLLGASAAVQAVHIFFNAVMRTPHPAAFVIGLVGLLLTAAAQGVQAWLAKDDISIVLGATYFGRGNTAKRWKTWHLPIEPADPNPTTTASFENVASTFVRGTSADDSFEDWRRQIGGILGLMGVYDIEIKDGATTPLSLKSSRLVTGYTEMVNAPTDPVKKKTVLPEGSFVKLYDATRGQPLSDRFGLGTLEPYMPVPLIPEGTPPDADAAQTADLLRMALSRALTNEAGANVGDRQTFASLPGLSGGAKQLEIVLEMPLPAWPGASNGAGEIVHARVIRRKAAP